MGSRGCLNICKKKIPMAFLRIKRKINNSDQTISNLQCEKDSARVFSFLQVHLIKFGFSAIFFLVGSNDTLVSDRKSGKRKHDRNLWFKGSVS